MWPFSKKWSAPPPQLGMVVSVSAQQLPTLVGLANPSGAEGAVLGMAGPASGEPSPENMLAPMQEGDYVAISPAGGICSVAVQRGDPEAPGLSLPPGTLEASGLTEEMLAKFNQPAWRVIIEMASPGNEVRDTVIFATRVAQRLAALGDGVVMDTAAFRFFGPDGWPVEEANPDFDAREHVHIHTESESGWMHTHGLIKFGRPEMEIHAVPPELSVVAFSTLLDIAQYVITGPLIEPGQTCGDPSQPFYAREGTKNRAEHWQDISVLELVDVNERGKPVSSGAPKALELFATA
jgi:hypothetical protein